MKSTLSRILLTISFYSCTLIYGMELDFPQTSLDVEVKKAINTGNVNAIKELAKNNPVFNLDKELFKAFRSYVSAFDNWKIKMLIKSGANVNQQDENGNTLLHHFFTLLTPELVRILLSTPNINPAIKNIADETPIDIAQKRIARNNADLPASVLRCNIQLISEFIANSKK